MAQLLKETTIDGINILDYFYPIGTVYETMKDTFDPNVSWGGTWERIKGKVLVGVDEDDKDYPLINKIPKEKRTMANNNDEILLIRVIT